MNKNLLVEFLPAASRDPESKPHRNLRVNSPGLALGLISFICVNFVDANLGYAVGNVGTILKTTDGGSSWSILASGSTSILLYSVFSLM